MFRIVRVLVVLIHAGVVHVCDASNREHGGGAS